jgi:hypothetical protein
MSTPSNSMNLNSTTSGLVNWNGSILMSSIALTQYYTMVGASANTVQNIAPGTSGQVLTSGGASAYPAYATIPFTQMPWTDEAASFNAIAGNGYFITATATATLPVPVANGAVVSFAVDVAPGTGKLTITAGAGGFIRIGKNISAVAATGGAVNNFQGDSITLVYRAVDLTWIAVPGTEGTWSLT